MIFFYLSKKTKKSPDSLWVRRFCDPPPAFVDSVVALRVSEGQRAGVQEEKGFGFLWPLLMPIARLRPPEIEMDSQTEGDSEEEE